MDYKKRIFIIIGSASEESSGERIVKEFIDLTDKVFTTIVFNELSTIPHFNPKLTFDNSPETVKNFRDQVAQADGVVICTPEVLPIDWTKNGRVINRYHLVQGRFSDRFGLFYLA